MFDKLKGNQRHSLDGSGPPPSYAAGDSGSYDGNGKNQHRHSMQSQTTSADPSTSTPFRSNFASVSLHMGDRIRFLQLPDEVVVAIRSRVKDAWPRGIQDERNYYGSWELKMRGNPWMPAGDDAIHARRLTREIMSGLYNLGWVLYISTDISRKTNDKDNLFFRHQDPAPAPAEWFSLTFSKGDRLRLIDAPTEVVSAVINALSLETQSHAPYRLPGVYELKFKGYPFMSSGGETIAARTLVLKLLSVLECHGFTVNASIDQKYGGEHSNETDTWHLCRPQGWAPGQPVYHA